MIMTRCWMFLLFSLAFCFQATYALQSHNPQYPIPWWSSEGRSYRDVPDDFDWENRRTGVTDHWTNGLAVWSHYDAEALSNTSSHDCLNKRSCDYPIPWNVGRMLKSLRRVTSDQGQSDDSAFELCSLYEPGACGVGFESFMKDRLEFGDNLLQQEHIFHKTSNRVSSTPGTSLPSDDNDNDDDNDNKNTKLAATSQATIVQKDSATFAGGRWLPSSQQAKEFLRVASKISSGDNSNNSLDEEGKKYNHMHIFELWLSEPVRDGQPDGRKIGMFCIYNGMTGTLLQFFRMNEVLLEEIEAIDPKMSRIDMDELETSLPLSNNVAWINSASNLLASKTSSSMSSSSSSSPSFLATSSSSMKEVLSTIGYSRVWGRAVKTVDVASGASVATELESSSTSDTPGYYFPPSNEEDYFQCRFEDGVYVRIPKRLSADMETIGLEIGCFTLNGEFHRLLAVGDRTQRKMHTNVYERWSKE